MVSKWVINSYNLFINGVYWGYNPLTNHLLNSWDIQVQPSPMKKKGKSSEPNFPGNYALRQILVYKDPLLTYLKRYLCHLF